MKISFLEKLIYNELVIKFHLCWSVYKMCIWVECLSFSFPGTSVFFHVLMDIINLTSSTVIFVLSSSSWNLFYSVLFLHYNIYNIYKCKMTTEMEYPAMPVTWKLETLMFILLRKLREVLKDDSNIILLWSIEIKTEKKESEFNPFAPNPWIVKRKLKKKIMLIYKNNWEQMI